MPISRDDVERLLIDALLFARERSARGERLDLAARLAESVLRPVADELRHIAHLYTEGRNGDVPPLSDKSCRAYALYYSLINFEKTQRLLKMYPEICARPNLRVLDYGCGPGTGALALLSVRDSATALSAVDNNFEMRGIAELLLRPFFASGELSSLEICAPGESKEKKFDLIIAAHVLNELTVEKQQSLARSLLSQLTTEGTLLVIETALKVQTRELMALRDSLLHDDPQLRVVFPCTHRNPCQMLKQSPDDWCHGSMSWEVPHLIRQLDSLTGFNKHRIKYSAFILSRNDIPAQERQYRVVGPPAKSKVGHSLSVCGTAYYGETLCRKRDRAEQNVEFRRASHYDLLTVENDETLGSVLDGQSLITRERAP